MLRMAMAFLTIALVAAGLDSFGIVRAATGTARIVFVIFMLLFLFCLGRHIYRGS